MTNQAAEKNEAMNMIGSIRALVKSQNRAKTYIWTKSSNLIERSFLSTKQVVSPQRSPKMLYVFAKKVGNPALGQ